MHNSYHVLSPKGTNDVTVTTFKWGERMVEKVTEDVEAPSMSKCKLSLQNRIHGPWLMEVRGRNDEQNRKERVCKNNY